MTVSALLTAATLMMHPAPASVVAQTAEPATRTDLGEGVFALIGRGGNIVFSTGPDGTFVVDDQFANNAASNISLIREVAPTAIVFVLNTHHHGDHAGGNPIFAAAGATIVAHDNVRTRLESAVEKGEMDESGLPAITFTDTSTFRWNGRDMKLSHIPGAHTDGDVIVHFRNANIIHTGDIMFSGRYPYIDLGAGGSVDGALQGLKAIHDLADENTVIVPGHGPISDRDDVKATIDMIDATRALVRAEMIKGLSREAVIEAAPLKDFDETYAWQFIDGPKFTGTLFDDLYAVDEEAKTAVDAGPAPTPAPAAAPSDTPSEPPAETPAPAAVTPAVTDAPAVPMQAPVEVIEEAHTEETVDPSPAEVTPTPVSLDTTDAPEATPAPAAPEGTDNSPTEIVVEEVSEAVTSRVDEVVETVKTNADAVLPLTSPVTEQPEEEASNAPDQGEH